jgi:hypothetical protein
MARRITQSNQTVESSKINELKSNFERILPDIIIWTLRVLLCFQAYMYNSPMGLFHLTWVLFSCITAAMSTKVTLFMTIIVLLPVYTWEFIVMYLSNVPAIQHLEFFEANKIYFPQ